ncbi:MAG: hypothetical protein COS29_03110 [Candidatus Omnitrophica bacterium CG02_land_8_20_14_3_00__42_8]|nr:MAG: hypothetical protein COS29_03110 [Candidatus Omnitrophica bacterium CG02_land_8_20_14_3_00__42_8]
MNKKLTGVILFGDSVLFGTGATVRNNGCSRILRGFLKDRPVIIKCKNRDTTKDGLKRLNFDVLDDDICSHVIILFGNNDCKLIDIDTPAVSLERYKENLTKIIKEIKNVDKIPILSNLQPIDYSLVCKTLPDVIERIANIDKSDDFHKKYSIVCNEVAMSENIKLADIFSELKKYGKVVIANDGIHPSDLGHKVIAQKFLDILM